jgi:hypothetical protein
LRQYEFLMDHPCLSMALARVYDPSLDLYKLVIRSDGLIHVDDPAGTVELKEFAGMLLRKP